jgi:hypothetical protein
VFVLNYIIIKNRHSTNIIPAYNFGTDISLHQKIVLHFQTSASSQSSRKRPNANADICHGHDTTPSEVARESGKEERSDFTPPSHPKP